MVRQFLVYDALDTCPYLPDRLARFPLRVSERKLRRDELDSALAEGDRRQGVFLYRPSCPTCSACEAIRIDIASFTATPSLRRILAKGDITLIRITEFRRLARKVRLLEIDTADDRLYVFTRWDLGTNPLQVLDALTDAGYTN